MHVCFLMHREYPQNHSTAMNEYARMLVEQGVDVTVIAGRESESVSASERVQGVSVRRLLTDTSTSVSVEPTRFGYCALRELDALCGEQQVDILHLLAFPNLGAILRPVPWLRSPPVWIADVRGTAVRNRLFDALSRWGLRLQRRLVDRMVVVDDQVATNIFGREADVDILPLGVDFDAFHPGESPDLRASWGVEPDDLVVGYTGSLHPPRRLDRLLDAFARVNDDRATLVVVGSGAALESLRDHAADLGLGDAVVFTGEVPFQDVPDYVRAFDIGFSYIPDKPQYRDQPPLKTVEFLATGLPVLGTDTPGNRRFLDGENGRLVPDSVPAYSNGLDRLLVSTDDRRTLAAGARESVREYDYDHIVREQLRPIYERNSGSKVK